MRALALAILLLAARGAHAGPAIDDPTHGFRARVPDGFVDFPEGRTKPQYLYAYRRGAPPALELLAFVQLSSETQRGRPDADAVARGMAAASHATLTSSELSELTWKGETLNVVSGTMADQGVTLGFMGAEVPVPHHGIFVMIIGQGSAGTLAATLGEVMGTFDGEIAYADSGSNLELLGGGAGAAAILGIVILVKRRRG